MKYIIILCDGMADEPLPMLDGKTPMEAAATVHMNLLAKTSELGMVRTIPEEMEPGSDTANLSVLGYDPRIYYSGRSPLEALSMGVILEESDVSFRCNLVTLSEEQEDYDKRIMLDHSAGEITSEEAAVLIQALKDELSLPRYSFYPGISYRHLLVQKHGEVIPLTPPHDILEQEIGDYLTHQVILRAMMEKSYDILQTHPINQERRKRGLRPANSAWFWGAGVKPSLPSFEEKYGIKGAMISAVDLLKGIAVGTCMDNIDVVGVTGGLDNDYFGQGAAAVKALLEEGYDFVYVHIEAPDEMGHQGRCKDKIKAIEKIDQLIVGPVMSALSVAKVPFRMLILPDHPTPVALRTHTKNPVPYLLYDRENMVFGNADFDEKTAKKTGILVNEGEQLIKKLFGLT